MLPDGSRYGYLIQQRLNNSSDELVYLKASGRLASNVCVGCSGRWLPWLNTGMTIGEKQRSHFLHVLCSSQSRRPSHARTRFSDLPVHAHPADKTGRTSKVAIQSSIESLRVAELLEHRLEEVNLVDSLLSNLVPFLPDVSRLRMYRRRSNPGRGLRTGHSDFDHSEKSIRPGLLRLVLKPLKLLC